MEYNEDSEHVSLPKKKFSSKKMFSEKLVAFLCLSMIKFCRTDKIKGIPLLKHFTEILKEVILAQFAHYW